MYARAPALALLAVLACLATAAPAHAGVRADVAALQVALRASGAYAGTVDGILGPGTLAGVRALQARARLAVDGMLGPRTRQALGRFGRPAYGGRPMKPGQRGWDVAALQFALATHGFASGNVDGVLGPRTMRALARFQIWAGLPADAIAGPGTLRALRAAPPRAPVRLLAPVRAIAGDRYGPRGARFHAGVDFPAPRGTPVTAAGFDDVAYAGFDAGGWGKLVIVQHRFGLRTFYAHLSALAVATGDHVDAGQLVGGVGSTGVASGPHLHFEVLVRGANVDPLSALAG